LTEAEKVAIYEEIRTTYDAQPIHATARRGFGLMPLSIRPKLDTY